LNSLVAAPRFISLIFLSLLTADAAVNCMLPLLNITSRLDYQSATVTPLSARKRSPASRPHVKDTAGVSPQTTLAQIRKAFTEIGNALLAISTLTAFCACDSACARACCAGRHACVDRGLEQLVVPDGARQQQRRGAT
jgi:hypothetical protein